MLLGGKLSLGHSGKQLLTSRGAQLDLKLSEGNKLEVASEKIGSYPRGNFNAAPPPISLCAACDCPSSTNSSVPGNTDSAKRRGQEAGGGGEAGVRIRVASFWAPSAYNCICLELTGGHF